MSNLDKIKKFKGESKEKFSIVIFGDANYHYARKISNSRFGHMPAGIAYCEKPEDVQECLAFCKGTGTEDRVPFRIRSGGHQHEGMSSASDILIIDLFKMYGAKIHVEKDMSAWIPSGMKLEVVYNELEKIDKIIPGGGCQSVNIGGITQGGGWGSHIRKYGLTCDSLLEVEMVKANGDIIHTEKMDKIDRHNILWALKGGGGGNFGVVTKFKFKLSDIGAVRTTFAIQWGSDEKTIKEALACWTSMHQDQENILDENLSCSASMSVTKAIDESSNPNEGKVIARVAGRFYGEKDILLKILKNRFGDILPVCNGEKKSCDAGQPLMQKDHPQAKNYFTSWRRIPKKTKKQEVVASEGAELFNSFGPEDVFLSEASENQFLTDFISGENDFHLFSGSQTVQMVSDGSNSMGIKELATVEEANICERSNYTVLPNAPAITCDAPHPHKITSAYPESENVDKELIDVIYKKLDATKYYSDVRRYMVWHCLGGKMTEEKLKDHSSFAYRDKPYMLQLQCWWNNSGKLLNDECRDKEYVEWVNKFRSGLEELELIEGAFINFVDKDIVQEISTLEGRLKLLTYYYGDNLDKLQEIKKQYDPDTVFDFEMGIPNK